MKTSFNTLLPKFSTVLEMNRKSANIFLNVFSFLVPADSISSTGRTIETETSLKNIRCSIFTTYFLAKYCCTSGQ